jgi:hypothetical protein
MILGYLLSITFLPLSQGNLWLRIQADQWITLLLDFEKPWMNHDQQAEILLKDNQIGETASDSERQSAALNSFE